MDNNDPKVLPKCVKSMSAQVHSVIKAKDGPIKCSGINTKLNYFKKIHCVIFERIY